MRGLNISLGSVVPLPGGSHNPHPICTPSPGNKEILNHFMPEKSKVLTAQCRPFPHKGPQQGCLSDQPHNHDLLQ